MGIVTKCCTSQYLHSDVNHQSKESENENLLNNINLINKIPKVKDSNEGLNYICSKECYNIITKISKEIFTKKLCKKMSTEEIYIFIKKVINWILDYKITSDDFLIIKYISKIQIYTKLGTKKIISELNELQNIFKKDEEEMLLRSLSDWIILSQIIMTIKVNNLWKNIDLEKYIKNYVFDGIYFLIKIKIKNNFELKESTTISIDKIIPTQINTKINSDTTKEIIKLISLVEDFVFDLTTFK